MAYRITMPNGNSHSSFVIHSIKLYEGKGVACLDARGKPLEYIPVADVEKGRRVRDMLNGALNGERRYRNLDWTFLNEPPASMPSQTEPVAVPVTTPVPATVIAPEPEPLPAPAPVIKPKSGK